jgi:endothelial-specific receptor tyrosine kinase
MFHVFNKACPPGYYGQTCSFYCQGDDDYCKGLLICLPDPYGCSCYTGWYGAYCNTSKKIPFDLFND